MNKFFQTSFIFDRWPNTMQISTFYLILAIFSVIFLIGIFAYFKAKKLTKTDKINSRFYDKLSSWGLWIGIIGEILLFFRFEKAPYLGMRFILICWFVYTIIWLSFIIKYKIKDIPIKKQEFIKKKEFEKYLR